MHMRDTPAYLLRTLEDDYRYNEANKANESLDLLQVASVRATIFPANLFDMQHSGDVAS